jgi:hypothetical protein
MQRIARIPWIFFFIAACIGLLLRWHFYDPIRWLKFPYWLHAHSHTMFLGWVLNALMVGYLLNYDLWRIVRYRRLFYMIQVALVGMLVSFPFQGYGVISVLFSTMHTVLVWVFAFWLFKDLKADGEGVSKTLAKGSMVIFMISSLAPFALGPLVANGLAHSSWYYFAVYYYLHFQYNGVFIFGILSLFFKLLEDGDIAFNRQSARQSAIILFASLFPGYFLSVLWSDPPIILNIVGSSGAIMQLIALFYFKKAIGNIGSGITRRGKALFSTVLAAFFVKSLLQLLSAHPSVARMAYDTRPFVIAYIHLVVVGVVTIFLIAWYAEKGWCIPNLGFLMLFVGFVGSEVTMVAGSIPFINTFLDFNQLFLMMLFSALMCLGIGSFAFFPAKH